MRACVIKPVATSAPRLSRRRINEGGWESLGRNARGRDSDGRRACVVCCAGLVGGLRDREGWFGRRRWVNANPREDTRWALRELTRESRVTANETHRCTKMGRREGERRVEQTWKQSVVEKHGRLPCRSFVIFACSSWNNLWRFSFERIRRRKLRATEF